MKKYLYIASVVLILMNIFLCWALSNSYSLSTLEKLISHILISIFILVIARIFYLEQVLEPKRKKELQNYLVNKHKELSSKFIQKYDMEDGYLYIFSKSRMFIVRDTLVYPTRELTLDEVYEYLGSPLLQKVKLNNKVLQELK